MDCLYYDNAPSMAYVLEHAFRTSPALLLQGSMYDNNLKFQLCWTPQTLEIIQLGVLHLKRKQKLASTWFREVMEVCSFHRIRVIARNVQNSAVEKKLLKHGFLPLGNKDYAFPF
jgi:hypothetical protein